MILCLLNNKIRTKVSRTYSSRLFKVTTPEPFPGPYVLGVTTQELLCTNMKHTFLIEYNNINSPQFFTVFTTKCEHLCRTCHSHCSVASQINYSFRFQILIAQNIIDYQILRKLRKFN